MDTHGLTLLVFHLPVLGYRVFQPLWRLTGLHLFWPLLSFNGSRFLLQLLPSGLRWTHINEEANVGRRWRILPWFQVFKLLSGGTKLNISIAKILLSWGWFFWEVRSVTHFGSFSDVTKQKCVRKLLQPSMETSNLCIPTATGLICVSKWNDVAH